VFFDDLKQRLEGKGFDQMRFEACLPGTEAIGFLAVAGDGDEPHVMTRGTLRYPSSQLISIHRREADVEHRDVRTKFSELGERGGTIEGHTGRVSHRGQHLGESLGRVLIVVNNQHPSQFLGGAWPSKGGSAARRARDGGGPLGGQRQAHLEDRTGVTAGAVG